MTFGDQWFGSFTLGDVVTINLLEDVKQQGCRLCLYFFVHYFLDDQ